MVAFLIRTPELSAELIPGLFNTGVDDAGERLPARAQDIHYALQGPVLSTEVFDLNAPISAPGAWVDPADNAMWIGPVHGTVDSPNGDYIYTLTFDLTGLIPETAAISGLWSSDNYGLIFLNGTEMGFSASSHSTLWEFQINEGFLAGTNLLEFHVLNSPQYGLNPSGVLVQNMFGQADPVPEPTTLSLLGLGGLVLRRRRAL